MELDLHTILSEVIFRITNIYFIHWDEIVATLSPTPFILLPPPIYNQSQSVPTFGTGLFSSPGSGTHHLNELTIFADNFAANSTWILTGVHFMNRIDNNNI